MIRSVAVLLVLAYGLHPVAHADQGNGGDPAPPRPYYLENNYGQLVPYGVGDLDRDPRDRESRRERYFRERQLRERWAFGPEAHRRNGFKPERDARQYVNREHSYGASGYKGYDNSGYRYYLRPYSARHRERHLEDFGRFSIRIDDVQESGRVIDYHLPVSPRFQR